MLAWILCVLLSFFGLACCDWWGITLVIGCYIYLSIKASIYFAAHTYESDSKWVFRIGMLLCIFMTPYLAYPFFWILRD